MGWCGIESHLHPCSRVYVMRSKVHRRAPYGHVMGTFARSSASHLSIHTCEAKSQTIINGGEIRYGVRSREEMKDCPSRFSGGPTKTLGPFER